jgi:putative ABC transport system permease protein
MIRHIVIAAWRNMAANKLQTIIAISGLALGLTAVILAGLIIRNQLGYDSFLPDHDRLFVAGVDSGAPGQPVLRLPYSPAAEAAKLAGFAGVAAVARICIDFDGHSLRNGAVKGEDLLNCADPGIFDVLRLTALYGDLKTALARPDAIVIPLAVARKYFGADNVVGRMIEVDGKHNLRVAAVVADLPVNGSNLRSANFVSGKAPWTDLALADHGTRGLMMQTFLRLAPDADAGELAARMRAKSDYLVRNPASPSKAWATLISLSELHASPAFSPGLRQRLGMFAAVALAILLLSVFNFVNLTMARSARRGTEVGVRKALGAGRGAMLLQFLGEGVLQALMALLLALAAVEWLAPVANNMLDSGAALEFGRNGSVLAALLAGTLLVGLAAGFYPALVQASFRPALVLKGGLLGLERAGLVRRALVTLQFVVLVALAIGAGVCIAQYRFALARTMSGADRILFVQTPKCDGEFRDKVHALPGVEATACTDISLIKDVGGGATGSVRLPDGATVSLDTVTVGPGMLEMLHQAPIAGRDVTLADHVADRPGQGDAALRFLVNQTAVRRLGIASAEAAIGRRFRIDGVAFVIVGVVRDFSPYALEKPIAPTAYYYRDVPSLSPLVALKLAPGNNAAVLAAVAQEWTRSGSGGAFQNVFLTDWLALQRLPLLHEGAVVGVFAAIAMLLGCLGLLGLSLSTAERRTKEIGIRKAMGADSRQIVTLLLWEFARPVLWANAIAWPLAFWAMQRWLNGFAFHVAVPLWLFPAVGAATLLVALLTVAGQAFLAARAKPVLALRYE